MRHVIIVGGVVEEGGDLGDDFGAVGSYEPDGSGIKGFGPFGGVAHHKDGFAESRGLFLDASAVGEDDVAFFHEKDEGEIVKRISEEKVCGRGVAEGVVDGFADVGVEVDRVEKIHMGIFRAQIPDGGTDVQKPLSEVLAAVACNQDQLASLIQTMDVVSSFRNDAFGIRPEFFVRPQTSDDPMEGVDDGVASDVDQGVRDVFFEKVLPTEGGWREVESRQTSGELAVHFFRPRAVDVPGAESRFDMADGDLPVKRSQRGGGGGRGVPVDEDDIGLFLLQNAAHSRQDAGGDVGQVLSRAHDVQVVARNNSEEGEDRIEHLAVLGGDAHHRLEDGRVRLEAQHQRGHLDGLGARPENEEDLLHLAIPQKSRTTLPAGAGGKALNSSWATRNTTMSARS